MKLVCGLPSLDSLNEISCFVDGVLLEDKEDILEEINSIKKLNIVPIYSLKEMVFPMELEQYKQKILLTKDTDCLYYITDLGLAHILKEFGLIHRTIFDPVTMITNSLDAKEYMSYGFKAIGLSNEITLKDTKEIIEKTGINAFLQVFGYRLMLNTRRHLISLYSEKIQKPISTKRLVLEEATRKDQYPIVETEQGTKIYRSELISLAEELTSLPIEYAFINSYGISEEILIQVLKSFHGILMTEDIETNLRDLNALGLSIGEGFAYHDSVYMKEEF
ncbi:MAG: U32 family peptidase [Anaeroplasmataceae bacterium]|nr:U32 family peptidase [Anaeroplasmataceae bacterium]